MRREKSKMAIESVKAAPRTAGLLLIDFPAWAVPSVEGQELALRERLRTDYTRAVWDLGENPNTRLAVTINECASLLDALEGIVVILEGNQLADVPRGPDDIGEISFVHPKGAPPAIFFVTANLVVSVFSFARQPVEVIPFARVIDAALRSRPPDAHDEGIIVKPVERGLIATPKWPGPNGYLKVIAPGSDLRLEDGTIVGAKGEVSIYYVEHGRETYRAIVTLGTV